MSVSAHGNTLDDTVARLAAMRPTVWPEVRWQWIGPEVDERAVGAETREYTTRETTIAEDETRIAGAGERQERYTITLRIVYRMTRDVDDAIAADHVDIINTLQPSSTYPTGSWGSCRIRRVAEVTRDDDADAGVVVVGQAVECILRYPVTI